MYLCWCVPVFQPDSSWTDVCSSYKKALKFNVDKAGSVFSSAIFYVQKCCRIQFGNYFRAVSQLFFISDRGIRHDQRCFKCFEFLFACAEKIPCPVKYEKINAIYQIITMLTGVSVWILLIDYLNCNFAEEVFFVVVNKMVAGRNLSFPLPSIQRIQRSFPIRW